ncbi:MAG: hypothetical protein NZO16_03540 [Deltaproteobacteria bacterium]|nr:hypothetical protein [Deltaproteobacteria bacterium]
MQGNILIIDDSVIVQTQLQIYCKELNLNCKFVSTLQEVSQYLERDFYDWILLDLNLNGTKVPRSFMEKIKGKVKKLILMSADFEEYSGFVFLQKPFGVKDLRIALEL